MGHASTDYFKGFSVGIGPLVAAISAVGLFSCSSSAGDDAASPDSAFDRRVGFGAGSWSTARPNGDGDRDPIVIGRGGGKAGWMIALCEADQELIFDARLSNEPLDVEGGQRVGRPPSISWLFGQGLIARGPLPLSVVPASDGEYGVSFGCIDSDGAACASWSVSSTA